MIAAKLRQLLRRLLPQPPWRRRLLILLSPLLLLAFSAVFLLFWGLHSQSGARWAWRQLGDALPALQAESISGSLSGGLRLNKLSYIDQGLTINAKQVDLAIEIDWLPWPSARIGPLRIQHAFVRMPTSETAAAKGAIRLADLRAPITIELADAVLSDFSLFDAESNKLAHLKQLELALSYGERLTLHQLNLGQLRVGAAQLDLALQGTSELQAPYLHQLSAKSQLSLERDQQTPLDLALTIDSQGDVEQLQLHISSRDQAWLQGFYIEAEVEHALRAAVLRAEYGLKHVSWPVESVTPQFELSQLQGQLSGQWPQLQTELAWQLKQPSIAAGPWQLKLAQQDQTWLLQDLRSQWGGLNLQAQGQINRSGNPAEIHLQIDALEPSRLLPQQAQALSSLGHWNGQITATRDAQELRLNIVDLAQVGGEGRIQAHASYAESNGQIQAQLHWQNLHWQGPEQALGSTRGELTLSGQRDAYQLNGEAQLEAEDYPPGQFRIRGQGDDKQFQLGQLAIDWLGGRIEGDGALHWQPQLAWDLNLATQSVNPRALIPSLDGELNLSAHSTGQQKGEDWDAMLELKQLSGQMLGRPLGGHGVLRYRQGQLSSEGFDLNSGSTLLQLHSAPAKVSPLPSARPAPETSPVQTEPTKLPQAIHWQLKVPTLGDWHDEAKGSLQAQGWLANEAGDWHAQLNIHSPTLSWKNWYGEALELQAQLRLPQSDTFSTLSHNPNWFTQVNAQLKQLVGPGFTPLAPWQGLQNVHLKFHSNAQSQVLNLSSQASVAEQVASAQSENIAAAIALQLSGGPWLDSQQIWNGQIDLIQFDHPEWGRWQQERSTKLQIRPQSTPAGEGLQWQAQLGVVLTEPVPYIAEPGQHRIALIEASAQGLCIAQSPPTALQAQARLCINGRYDRQDTQLNASLEGFDLAQLNPWLSGLNIKQSQAHLGLQIQQHQQKLKYFALELALSPGLLSPSINKPEQLSAEPRQNGSNKANQFSLDRAQLSAYSQDNGKIQVAAALSLDGDAELSLGLALSPWQAGTAAEGAQTGSIDTIQNTTTPHIQGQLKVNWQRLASLHKLRPDIGPISGQLLGDWRFNGPWLRPQVEGQLQLSQLSWSDARTGLRLRQGEIQLHGSEGKALLLDGSFLLGEERAKLNGQIDITRRQWQLELNGHNLALLNGPQGKLYASPQLSFSGNPQQINIDGRIDIPQAKLRPVAGSNPVRVSADVVLAGEEPEVIEPGPKIYGQLQIKLGDAVQVAADNARAQLAGELDLSWSGEPIPNAQGQIRLEQGGVRAYGQNLDIQRGLVVFENGPVDDPRLDIRAARRIFGDPAVDLAGVQVGGTAQSPTIRLYTEPNTNEERALSYLVTGSNFDHGNGQGALSVGIYLLPRLFVSYGFGLFENGNVISTRYELSDRWSVQAMSGARDTGVDLSWSVDR